MTFQFHANRQRYFEHQRAAARESIVPRIDAARAVGPGTCVLEIGSAEGGVLKAFLDRGCRCVGIERNPNRVELARGFLAQELAQGAVELIEADVYDVLERPERERAFDVIVLKDVIEHIHDQGRLIRALRELLAPEGVVFFGFPPWQMPFGGHQQMCANALLSKLPYVHLLPRGAYERLLRGFGESETKVRNLLEIKQTGLTLERFEALVADAGFRVRARELFLLSPIYKHKFGLPTLRQVPGLRSARGLRNYFTTAAYYVVA